MRQNRWILPVLIPLVASCSEPLPPDLRPPSRELLTDQEVVCTLIGTNAEIIEAIAALGAQVDALRTAGSLNSGQVRALLIHLGAAERHLDEQRVCAALAGLHAFKEQVEEFTAAGALTEAEAAPMLALVSGVLGLPGASAPAVTIVSPQNGEIVPLTGSVSYVADPGTTAVGCTLNAEPVPCTSASYAYALQAGIYTFTVTALAGETVGTTATVTFIAQ